MLIPPNYGIWLLEILINGAILFALLFTFSFVALLIRRVIEQKLMARWDARAKLGRTELLRWLNGPEDVEPKLENFTKLPVFMQLDVIEGLALMMKGAAASRLTKVATELGLTRILIKRINGYRLDHRLTAARQLALFNDPESEAALDKALHNDKEVVATVVAEGLLHYADDAQADTIGQVMLNRGFDPEGKSKPVFKLLAKAFPNVLLALAQTQKFRRQRDQLLTIVIDTNGSQIVPILLRHDALDDPSFRAQLHELVRHRTEPSFRRLREKLIPKTTGASDTSSPQDARSTSVEAAPC